MLDLNNITTCTSTSGAKWSELKPELKRIYWFQFYFEAKSTTKVMSSYVRSITVVKKVTLQHLGQEKKEKELIP